MAWPPSIPISAAIRPCLCAATRRQPRLAAPSPPDSGRRYRAAPGRSSRGRGGRAAIKSRRDGFSRMGIGSEIVHRGRRKPGYSAGRRRSHKKPHGLAPQLFWLAFIVGGNELELIAGMATFTNAGGLATLLEALQ